LDEMTQHERNFEGLSAYLDGELSVPEAARIEKALQTDEALAAELERLRKVRALLRGMDRQTAPRDFVARVMDQAERTRLVGTPAVQVVKDPLRWVRHLATAAVLILAVGIGVVITQNLWWPKTIEEYAKHTPPADESAMRDDREAARPERAVVAKGAPELPAGPAPVTVKTDGVWIAAAASVDEHSYGMKAKGGALARVAHRGYAGDLDPDTASTLVASIRNTEAVYSKDLPAARRQIESAIVSNNLRFAAPAGARPGFGKAGPPKPRQALRYAVQTNPAAPKQMRVIVVGPRTQVRQLQQDLRVAQQRPSRESATVAYLGGAGRLGGSKADKDEYYKAPPATKPPKEPSSTGGQAIVETKALEPALPSDAPSPARAVQAEITNGKRPSAKQDRGTAFDVTEIATDSEDAAKADGIEKKLVEESQLHVPPTEADRELGRSKKHFDNGLKRKISDSPTSLKVSLRGTTQPAKPDVTKSGAGQILSQTQSRPTTTAPAGRAGKLARAIQRPATRRADRARGRAVQKLALDEELEALLITVNYSQAASPLAEGSPASVKIAPTAPATAPAQPEDGE
jgi:anti-sigma factor RsiW